MKRVNSLFLPFFIIGIFFFLRSFFLLDPDFGWHIRLGQLILEKGIPFTDPFSYTMPSFPFVDHEWIANIIMYAFYLLIGYSGLSLLFSLLGISALYLQLKIISQKWAFVPLLLAGAILFSFIGIRPQVFSWVLFSVLLVIMRNPKLWLRWRFFIPLFFMFWANLHGSFGIGIVLLSLFVLGKSIEQKKLIFIEYLIIIVSIGVTLINPYGVGLWGEVYNQLSDSSLRWKIAEWYPSVFVFLPVFWFFVVLSLAGIVKYRKIFLLEDLIVYFSFLIAGLSSLRHIPFFVFVAFPLLSQSLFLFFKEAEGIVHGSLRFRNSYRLLLGISLAMVFCSLLLEYPTIFLLNVSYGYPQKAFAYLKAHPSLGNVFTEYQWGGYYIWQFPDQKVFIDGRMPSWKSENDPLRESKNVFLEYEDLIRGKRTFKEMADKYHIHTIILSTNKKTKKQTFESSVATWINQSMQLPPAKQYDPYKQLEDTTEWQLVYKDNLAVIYQRK